ncbi:MAG: sialidase family protein [Planctomycetota bacterium]|nr:sialidase family protein [Planctomycetota bacterium]
MTRFTPIHDCFIRRVPNDAPLPAASGPRLAVLNDGTILCSYMVQSKLGINDFVPMLARSVDGGATWAELGPVWPELQGRYSIFCNLSRSPAGDLFLYGSRTIIGQPGESFWSEENQGILSNELFWSTSRDGGKTWSKQDAFGMPVRDATSGPLAGSAEAPGPLCVTRSGRWVGPYSPYNTFDPRVQVDRGRVVVVLSEDRGDCWTHAAMLRFAEPLSGGAEAWCVELADGRLLGVAWHTNLAKGDAGKVSYPNAYALSSDGGATWTPTRSTGTPGHTTALTAMPDGKALFCFVQRNPASAAGIYLAIAAPTPEDFGLQTPQAVWQPATRAKDGKAVGLDDWTGFNFGEPSTALLPDGTVLLSAWFSDATHSGVLCRRLRMG